MCEHCGCQPASHQSAQSVNHHPEIIHAHHDHNDHKENKAEKPREKVKLQMDVLEKNSRFAKANRSLFSAQKILALNVISSPGSGKTSLLVKTIEAFQGKFPQGVIEGDQQSEIDAQRIRQTGVEAVQIQTGKGCHLDAHSIGHALEEIHLPSEGILWIENVGNLICPALFDLGETKRVLLLSVAEGDDKPLKYPEAFYGADLLVLTKIDLLPYVDFSVEKCMDGLRRIRPGMEVVGLSAKTGEGIEKWLHWVSQQLATVRG
ncbi:hydrogenase nickel incorporation protein HypB [Methylacidiphilum kamchatkense]|uniref:Hydrogenase nickel incorporation protein HypB n=1 Tax=Methylacidiphilum kamchatkense Kam1 TaxID=1202785 RepID=A0A516TLF5_9BACT|nr:hydrogenase nickel incorporation protein HypB [Methylacidiphilum kamchatkense]QDQ42073.1 hydrogenase nickel incorporation protein HypB [Methylacidiphilum kamchatkense Kam1]